MAFASLSGAVRSTASSKEHIACAIDFGPAYRGELLPLQTGLHYAVFIAFRAATIPGIVAGPRPDQANRLRFRFASHVIQIRKRVAENVTILRHVLTVRAERVLDGPSAG